jgi:uncharacterized damage-inducible protein DinB
MRIIDRYIRWFNYEKEAHDKVIKSFQTVPVSRRDDENYQKALTLFAHMLAARQLWAYRLGIAATAPTDFFPTGVTLSDLAAQSIKINQLWTEALSRLTDDDIGRVFLYNSLEGGAFRNVVEDVLAQLYGHSWYHRGQIAALIKSLGGVPAITDFVYWTREPV